MALPMPGTIGTGSCPGEGLESLTGQNLLNLMDQTQPQRCSCSLDLGVWGGVKDESQGLVHRASALPLGHALNLGLKFLCPFDSHSYKMDRPKVESPPSNVSGIPQQAD